MRIVLGILLLGSLPAAAAAQVTPYGSSTPPGFATTLDAGGRIPFVGSPFFGLRLLGTSNPIVAAAILGASPASIPVGGLEILVDPAAAALLGIPSGQTTLSLPIPPDPALAGATAYAQVAVVVPTLPMGIGLTNGIVIDVLPDPTPKRAYFGIQDFSTSPAAPGGLAILDLETTPPSFRATGPIGFSGSPAVNFSPKVSLAEATQVAFALGNETSNDFVRAFDLSADPMGVVNFALIADTQVSLPIHSTVGWRDLEVTSDGTLLFVTSGASSPSQPGLLEAFDVTGLTSGTPGLLLHSIPLPAAGGGPIGLDRSPDDAVLALLVGSDNHPPLTLYSIDSTSPTPLVPLTSFALSGFLLGPYPNDVDFAPTGSLLLVSAGNGSFAVIDPNPAAPSVLLDGGTWPATQSSSVHGAAVAVQGGTPVGIVGDAPTTGGALYYILDLNALSATFGSVVGSFTTNVGGNISNHRIHAQGSVVVAIDGTAPAVLSQFVDVIDLDGPPSFLSWRIQTPSTTSLASAGLTSIPRDFDLK